MTGRTGFGIVALVVLLLTVGLVVCAVKDFQISLVIFLVLIILSVLALVFWVIPISLGVECARRKNYSPLWMLFGIHPFGGWIAFIVLACLPGRVICQNCGGQVSMNFWQCPYCHNSMRPTTPGAPPPMPGTPIA